MTIEVPNNPARLSMAEVIRGAHVENLDYQQIARIAHRLYGTRQGQRGAVPIDGSIQVSSESSTLVASAWSRFSRPLGGEPSRAYASLRAKNNGGSGTLTLELYRREGNGSLVGFGSQSVALSSALNFDISWSSMHEGGSLSNPRALFRWDFNLSADSSGSPVDVPFIWYYERITTDPNLFV